LVPFSQLWNALGRWRRSGTIVHVKNRTMQVPLCWLESRSVVVVMTAARDRRRQRKWPKVLAAFRKLILVIAERKRSIEKWKSS
jgi:hypothetical protein